MNVKHPPISSTEKREQAVLLSEVEVARRYGLTVKCLQAWRYRRCGPVYIKVGDGCRCRVRYPLDALCEWERQHTATPAGSPPDGDER